MIRVRWTWFVVGGVATLLLVAGVDALRSSDEGTTAATTGAQVRCTEGDIAVSVEVRTPDPRQLAPDGLGSWRQSSVPTIVVRHVGGRPCFQDYSGFRFTITDRAGSRVGWWNSDQPWFGGKFSPGTEQTFSLPYSRYCDRPGPYAAFATVDPYSARLENLSYPQIACFEDIEDGTTFEGDGYSFTYPVAWAKGVDDLSIGSLFMTAFARDAATASAELSGPEKENIFSPGPDLLVLKAVRQREPFREENINLELRFRRAWLKQQGELLEGPTHVTVAGLPALRSEVHLGNGVILNETLILGRTTWYFLDCRFSSKGMKRGCDQVEETFEVA
jgi:hypothetical protein